MILKGPKNICPNFLDVHWNFKYLALLPTSEALDGVGCSPPRSFFYLARGSASSKLSPGWLCVVVLFHCPWQWPPGITHGYILLVLGINIFLIITHQDILWSNVQGFIQASFLTSQQDGGILAQFFCWLTPLLHHFHSCFLVSRGVLELGPKFLHEVIHIVQYQGAFIVELGKPLRSFGQVIPQTSGCALRFDTVTVQSHIGRLLEWTSIPG